MTADESYYDSLLMETEDFLAPEVAKRLEKDLLVKAGTLDASGARALVDFYYRLQKLRVGMGNQKSSLTADDNTIIDHFHVQMAVLEESVKPALKRFAEAHTVGRWAMEQYGIGHVISAGLLAHIDISRVETVGQIWRYAGLDPNTKWDKGEKRPWNADLKLLCYKIGDSFMKFHKRDDCFYGKLYAQDKARRLAKNEAGDYADLAKQTLDSKNIRDKDLRATLERGMLPAGRIELQARRYATKIFLSHWFEVAYFAHNGKLPPKPWVLEHGGHAHYIPIPHIPEAHAKAVEDAKPKL